MEEEGVIKFSAQHEDRTLPPRFAGLCAELDAWRHILGSLGMVGQDEQRYGGAGFGNMSASVEAPGLPMGQRRFLISGSQTGHRPALGMHGYCLVSSYSIRDNRVTSEGPVLPSSEAMTHSAIYDLGPHIRYVFHAHAPRIWRQARRLGLPTTAADVPYGTQAMAQEVRRLYHSTGLAQRGILAMAGHEDGIIALGHKAEEAGRALVAALALALALDE